MGWKSSVGQSATIITGKILSALEKHGITGVYNFANSGTGLMPNDDSTVLPFDSSYRSCVDAWVQHGQHIANHTHSHVAVYETTLDDFKTDVLRGEKLLSPWMSRAPTKFFCLCTDCQGDTTAIAQDIAAFLHKNGYHHLPAASMVFEWRWEGAYLGALASGDREHAARIRSEFVEYSVRQTVLDYKRGRIVAGDDFVPSLLLHMLNIVADSMEEWLSALK